MRGRRVVLLGSHFCVATKREFWLRRVLKGWKECSKVEIKGETNCGARKDSKSTFGVEILG